ncbi:MAG: error-prone DNA polymerase [Thalassobaculaceae bacterium]|nr:error-prone DNA polymerase [Thalassobaculaceae bacterium]
MKRSPIPRYAELQVTTNFSFLRGGSHGEELVEQAAALGLAAIAVTDRNTLAGVVRAHVAAKEVGVLLVIGARLDLMDAPDRLVFPVDRAAYGRLSRLISLGRRRAPKGECHLFRADLEAWDTGLLQVLIPPEDTGGLDAFAAALSQAVARRPGDIYLAVSRLYRGDDAARVVSLAALAHRAGAVPLATNDIHIHVPERRPLQDVLTCIREGVTVDAAGYLLAANAERHLKTPQEMARLFRDHPALIAATVALAARCRFSLDELRYEYPDEVAAGEDPQIRLARLTRDGADERYAGAVPPKVQAQLDHELALIARLGYAPYFLTVQDVVRFARSKGILCQGRGSAANSAVCYCLGITAVDPAQADLLFERFVSEARGEPPDIDVDFEHERREEVIQYVYAKYGRERAGLAATVISYRARSALRDVGKALGLSEDTVGALSGQVWGWRGDPVSDARVREIGLDPDDRRLALALALARQLAGFPRHLSQHVGGFVITRGRLDELVPIENAAMENRTVVEWDKDDLEALGILKVDLLGLGMLSCVKRAFDLLGRHYGEHHTLASVPDEDPAVYDMLCRGDSLGVFQVESRAQMAMLPRLRPRCFYDLVVEVAIVRPGPIQGDMVHPYLRRRNGEEPVTFPSEALRAVLGKTLGVPLFQEQAMKIAIVAAGFTPSEADRLRKAMATFKRSGDIHKFQEKLVQGMVERGYEAEFAARCFKQIEGFGTYGFPESHAASFALLVYVSSWLKCHYPAVFAAALLNSQPMGFYAPAQIVRDARDHGVEIRPPDVNASHWDCTLEPRPDGAMALRLGLRQIKGMKEETAQTLTAARGAGYGEPLDLWRRAGLGAPVLEVLARGDAFRSMGVSRREAFWAARALATAPDGPAARDKRGREEADALPLFAAAEAAVALPAAPIGEEVVDDYASLRMSLKAHPVALLRPDLQADGRVPCSVLESDRGLGRAGRRVRLAGLVLVRQRPGTAKGVIFITLEDETGIANLVVWQDIFERYRREVLGAKLLGVVGRVQREGRVVHVVVEHLEDLTDRLATLTDGSLERADAMAGFTAATANADEVRRPSNDQRAEQSDAKKQRDADGERRRAMREAREGQAPDAPAVFDPETPPAPARPTRSEGIRHPRNVKPDLKVVSRDFH